MLIYWDGYYFVTDPKTRKKANIKRKEVKDE